MTDLSVIIPTLDEAHCLAHLLRQIGQQQGLTLEVIVADGGSIDGTPDRAREFGAQVLQTGRGRAVQMNAAAKRASSDYLLFLHADSELGFTAQLRVALDTVQAEVEKHGPCVAGHFTLRFIRRSLGHRLFYRYIEEKTELNRPHTINGDQGLLLPKAYFETLGGFDERLPFLEDQRLAARIRDTGLWICLPGRLLTSARRFEAEGHYRRYTLMSIIMGMHAAGVEEFFEQAPKVYAVQAETRRLRMTPYLALVRKILFAAGWRRALQIEMAVARFARSNAWQLFFWWDVLLRPLLGPGRYPMLWVHDKAVRPLINNRVVDGLTAILLSLWFLGVLPLAYALLEWRRSPD
jgi:rSAM/selenodomain-associated transferase 2